MRILWLTTNLLLPLDKGGKLRTWHLMRHLARTPRDHLRLFRRSRTSRRRTRRHVGGLLPELVTVPRRERTKEGLRFFAAVAPQPVRAAAVCRGAVPSAAYRAHGAEPRLRASRSIASSAISSCPRSICPSGCRARRCSSPTTSRPRSGGGTRRPARVGCGKRLYAAAVAANARFRATLAGAGSIACWPSPMSIETRCTASIRGASTSQVVGDPDRCRHRVFRCGPAGSGEAAPPRLHRVDGLAAERRRRRVLLSRDPAAGSREAEPDVTFTIVGRSPTPAVRRLAGAARDRGDRHASRMSGPTWRTRRSTSCRYASAAARASRSSKRWPRAGRSSRPASARRGCRPRTGAICCSRMIPRRSRGRS